MIAELTGLVRVREPTRVVLEVSGIGFELTIPLSTSKALEERTMSREPQSLTLFVQTAFTRDGVRLFGFAEPKEKDVFNRLTAITGIGPKAALNLLSRFTPDEITAILAERKIETLKTVPGIGPKKAERILKPQTPGSELRAAPPISDPKTEQALTALTALGLTRTEALRRLEQIPKRDGLDLSELLTLALRHRD